MASNLRKIGSLRMICDVGGFLHCEAAQRWQCLSMSTAAAAVGTSSNMHTTHAHNRNTHAMVPQQRRTLATTIEAPAAVTAFPQMHGVQDARMATAQQSILELLGKIEAESKVESGKGEEIASALRQFDGAAVILQTGVLCNVERPIAKEVLARIAPLLRSTAHTFTLQQATNVLSTIALLSFCVLKLIAAVVDKVIPEIPKAPVSTIAALCYALGISGYWDHRLMRELESLLEARQAEFDVESYAKVVWMMGRAHHKTAAACALVDALADRGLAEHATPQEVVYAMWACGLHEVHLDELSDQALNVVAGRTEELSGGELAKLSCGLLAAEVRDEELYEEIATTAAEHMGIMCPRDIAKLMYSLGRVQAGDRSFAAAAGPHVLTNLDHFTYNELDMIVQAYNAWGVHDETSSAIAKRMAPPSRT